MNPRGFRVLYVEDNPFDADLTRRALSRAAPQITLDVAKGMTEALALLNNPDVRYDVLLTDLRMPDGDGMALLGLVRERALPLAVVVITGSGDGETAAAALRAGADDYVVKRADYLARLPQVLEGAFARNAAERDRRAEPLRVLYIEHDERDIDLTVRHFSRAAPHLHVTPARTLQEGLKLATSHAWDAILLDYRMPDGASLEVVKTLRDEYGVTAPVLLVTGHGDEEVAVRALRIGVTDYLIKTDRYLLRVPLALESAVYRSRTEAARVALAASEARFRRLAENAQDAIYRVRVQSPRAVEFVNRALVLRLGHPPEDYYRNPSQLVATVHPDDRALFAAALERPEAQREVFTVRHNGRDGDLVWMEHRLVAVRNDEGLVTAVEGIGRDVTERRRLEAQLVQSQKMEAIGRLAGGVAHDVNNLITAVMGWAELATYELPPESPVRADLTSIQDAASRAAAVARQLIAVARKQEVSPCPVDLNEQIRGLSLLLTRLVGPKVHIEQSLSLDALTVLVDPTQFEQVLVNLAINARDAMPEGGKVVIETSATQVSEGFSPTVEPLRAGAYAVVAVTDTGLGIPPEVLPMVFEPFFTTKSTGTGLGLATCYGVIRQHNGHVSVYSEVGVGTTFKIYLPLESVAPGSWPPIELTDDTPRGTETVLLAEDDHAVSAVMARTLRRLGYTVLVAADGRDALEVAAELPPSSLSLVVADVVMPRLGGRALVEALRARCPGLRALYISAYPEGAIIAHRRLDPGAPFLSKPFAPALFARRVREMLDASRT